VAVIDAPNVGQILRNLIEDAITYAGHGGPIEARVEADDRWLRFSVPDRSAGIPAGEQERIFEKFYRVNVSISARGTGLGLYICRELVRRMDGQIWVESTLGDSSTFAFELPV
jgi:signal transduction histidine kinase